MEKPYPRGLMWFRRDLRVDDNAALHAALRACEEVLCVFMLDRDILDALPRTDRRVDFILGSLVSLDAALREASGHAAGGLIVRHAHAAEEIPRLAQALHVQAVFANHDYEPDAVARDARVRGALADAGIAFATTKDQVIFELDEVMTQAGTPYTVFTPYKRAWLARLDDFQLKAYPVRKHARALAPRPSEWRHKPPAPADIGFEVSNLAELPIPTGIEGGAAMLAEFLHRIDDYDQTRDYPAVKGPSYLGVHLRFGTVSIRHLAREAHERGAAGSHGARVWLSELVWRDFYAQILANFPHVATPEGHWRTQAFKPEYGKIRWVHGKQAQARFEAWCEGRTGYPIVDAAMAQINQSGYMHNRLRMVVASFLCKDLGVDWRRGEAYFAEKLNDFELASNNGGWQWAASSGCDAQPWFRIFNPVTQSRKFDAEGRFIRRYLPQLAALPDTAIHAPWTATPVELEAAGLVLGRDYPAPLVEHDEARRETLARYAVVRGGARH